MNLTLYSDAKASHRRFAICDRNGDPLWHGRFFDDDRGFDGEQSSGEMEAAKKAVWLAGKIKQAIGAADLTLTLMVDAEWLCWANEAMKPDWNGKTGGKAKYLALAAKKAGICLDVQHVRGVDNPADAYTVCTGFKKWSDNDLTVLAA